MPEVEIINEQTASCGQSDGRFDLQVTGGVAPYFFDVGAGESTNSSFQNLSTGTYDVTITDASSCSQVKTIEVKGNAEITAQIVNQLPAACGSANGSFIVSPSGGQDPYSFILNNQNYSNSVFTDLVAGPYELQTTDANGCSTISNIEIESSEGASCRSRSNSELWSR